MADFGKGVVHAWSHVDPDPRTRTFAGLKRGPDGSFSDDDIARVLQDSTEKVAGTYRARGSPAALRIVEVMGMLQARQWGVCTMNEFRTWLGLKTFDSFEEWNPDREIAVSFSSSYSLLALGAGLAPRNAVVPGAVLIPTRFVGRGS